MNVVSANIGGTLDADGGVFSGGSEGVALRADDVRVAGNIDLRNGFTANGEVDTMGADVGGDFSCVGAKLTSAPTSKSDMTESNMKSFALKAEGLKVGGNVFIRDRNTFPFSAHGTIDFIGADIKGYMQDLTQDSSYSLDLRFATIGGVFYGQRESWPAHDHLDLDGFVYGGFGPGSTMKPDERLQWLRLQPKDRFTPQPYEQLAKVLRESGDDWGARQVLIAMESDKRSHPDNPLRRLWNWILWATIGYGYDTWRAVWFSAILVVIGSLVFRLGGRRAWIISIDEHPDSYKPFNGFIYSLETLLPFVDLYQAKHWLPNAQSRAGRNLRRYLWVHTLLGWFLASMIIAGVSGVVQK